MWGSWGMQKVRLLTGGVSREGHRGDQLAGRELGEQPGRTTVLLGGTDAVRTERGWESWKPERSRFREGKVMS